MNILIAGAKGTGKSTIGKELVGLTGLSIIETDDMVEQIFAAESGRKLTCRQIYMEKGPEYFRSLESQAARMAAEKDWQFVILGGSILMNPDNRRLLRNGAMIVYLTASVDITYKRVLAGGLPPWLRDDDSFEQYAKEVAYRNEVLTPFADIIMDSSSGTPAEMAARVVDLIKEELSIRSHAANTYGQIIHMTTFGESHGPAIGAVLDGVRPGLEISAQEIQAQLDRRRPGQSEYVTPRSEKDTVHILSGVFEGKTTGAPIAMVLYNQDQDSSKYEGIKDMFRPGHADFTFYKKYGIRDYRGGGRSSGRETAGRVMCGAIARKVMEHRGVSFIAHATEIAGIKAQTCDYGFIEKSPVRCGDPVAAEKMQQAIIEAKEAEDSVGGIVQLEIKGVPAGLGDPVFDKLDARLCKALFSLGATKGIEVGLGFELSKMRGSESNDNMKDGGFVSNNAGGIIGGISTGQDIIIRIGIKPTSSIASEQQTIGIDGENKKICVHGRHDPCIVPRVIPVVENMAALVIWDAWETQCAVKPDWNRD